MPEMKVYPYERLIEVTEEELNQGIVHIECPACKGTGIFAANPEYEQPCVQCSTRGTIPVSLA